MTPSALKVNNSKLVKASARHLRIAPRKMRLVTNMVKNMNASDALTQLMHLNKKGAPILGKLISSAIANAANNFSLDPKFLYIKSVTTDGAKVMKRYFPRARGSAFAIHRRMSHVNIVLEERKSAKSSKSKLPFLKKSAPASETPNVDQAEQTAIKPAKEMGRRSEVTKTEQQMKLNKAQNKRRLFNRKSGE